MSDWRVIVPEATTNLISNPSIEAGTTGWTNVTGCVLSQVTTGAKWGLYALKCVFSGVVNDRFIYEVTSYTSAGTEYTVSVWLSGSSGGEVVQVGLYDDVSGYQYIPNITATTTPTRYARTATFNAGSSIRAVFVRIPNATAITVYFDGWQLEEKGYETTYCDGTQAGCAWNGAEHASTATRSAASRAGGRIYDLQEDYSLDIGGVTGAGAAPVRLSDDPYAMLSGGQLNSAKVESRTFSLSGVIRGTSTANLNAKRQALVELFAHDAYPKDDNGWQPVRLRYTGAAVQKQISVHYEGGLDLDIRATDPCYWERVTVRFFAPDPFWYEIGNSAALLDSNDTDTLRYIVGRHWDTGTWDNLNVNNNPTSGNIEAVVVGPDGWVYIGGDFVDWNNQAGLDRVAAYDPSAGTWSAVGGAGDFADGTVYALAFGPGGVLYAGGDFTTGGGSPADYIAQCNAGVWSALGNPDQGAAAITFVLAIAVDRIGDVYVGGSFLNWSDIADADYLAVWDLSAGAYASVAAGANGSVWTICVAQNNDKYFGGSFANWGDANGDYVVKWDGTTLSSLGTGVGGGASHVKSIVQAKDGIIYMAGDFTTADGVTAYRVAGYNGVEFFALGGGMTNNEIDALAIAPNGNLWAVGTFTTMGDLGVVDPRAVWDGATWAESDLDISGGHTHDRMAIGRHDPLTTNNYDVYIIIASIPTGYFPGSATVANSGTTPAFPRIKVSRSGGTAAVLRSIQNATTSKRLQFNYDLQDGETLTIDASPNYKSITSDFYGLRMDAMLARSTFGAFALQPGDNIITMMVEFSGAPTITTWMEWVDTYRSYD